MLERAAARTAEDPRSISKSPGQQPEVATIRIFRHRSNNSDEYNDFQSSSAFCMTLNQNINHRLTLSQYTLTLMHLTHRGVVISVLRT